MTNRFSLADRAARALSDALGVDGHDVALVLGSGWGASVDVIGTTVAEVDAADILGFPPSTVPGHGGSIRSLDADGVRVLAFLGRVHGYEGHEPAVVVHGVRVAAVGGMSGRRVDQCGRVAAGAGAGGYGRADP